MAFKGRTPTEEEQDYLDDIVDLGCVICWLEKNIYTPPQVHHPDGKTKPEAHMKAIPLCYWHHMADQQNPPTSDYTSRHPDKKAFIERYGTEEYLHEQTERLILEKQNGVIFY